VHQSCKCDLPLFCECSGDGSVQYLLGDVNLMSMDDSQSTTGEWNKMMKHAPTGTKGMMAPEVQSLHVYIHSFIYMVYKLCRCFFVTDEGVHFSSHKSDVYSVSTSMMKVLIGKTVNAESRE